MKNIISLIAGFVFSIGLGIGGMTDPNKIFGFLDITGNWEADLVFVMAGAVGTYFVIFSIFKKRSKSLLGFEMFIPKNRDIDKKLLLGAFLFGIGWGLGGYCPGPAITSLSLGSIKIIGFIGMMILGMNLVKFFEK